MSPFQAKTRQRARPKQIWKARVTPTKKTYTLRLYRPKAEAQKKSCVRHPIPLIYSTSRFANLFWLKVTFNLTLRNARKLRNSSSSSFLTATPWWKKTHNTKTLTNNFQDWSRTTRKALLTCRLARLCSSISLNLSNLGAVALRWSRGDPTSRRSAPSNNN